MTEALWHDIDQWLVERIDQDLRDYDKYADLTIETVETALVVDILAWEKLIKPAVVVMGYDVVRSPGPHGDGSAHLDKRYRYALMVLTEGPQSDAIRDAKILLARLESLMRELLVDLDLVPDDIGETIQTIDIGSSSLTAERKSSSKADTWMIVAGMGVDLISEV